MADSYVVQDLGERNFEATYSREIIIRNIELLSVNDVGFWFRGIFEGTIIQ